MGERYDPSNEPFNLIAARQHALARYFALSGVVEGEEIDKERFRVYLNADKHTAAKLATESEKVLWLEHETPYGLLRYHIVRNVVVSPLLPEGQIVRLNEMQGFVFAALMSKPTEAIGVASFRDEYEMQRGTLRAHIYRLGKPAVIP